MRRLLLTDEEVVALHCIVCEALEPSGGLPEENSAASKLMRHYRKIKREKEALDTSESVILELHEQRSGIV